LIPTVDYNKKLQLDSLLVFQAQLGDKLAFDHLMQKYQNRVLLLATNIVKNPSDAEDVAQEAFLRAYRGLSKFKGKSAFYSWLHRIVINVSMNHLTSRARRNSLNHVEIESAEKTLNSWQLHATDGPEELLINDEIINMIQNTIEQFTEPMRVGIILYEFDGKSYEEIAQIMNCPLGTVRSRLFRAREAIDVQLQRG
jgi:RNA polymerase sigma-70 factor (ECF subfamily)